MGIEELRAQIDKLDAEIVRLLSRRGEAAAQIGKLKEQRQGCIYSPEREEQVLRRVQEANRGPLAPEALRAIYTEIVSACRALERRPRVAFLGPEGTFTHQGAKARFGTSADLIAVRTIKAAFAAVLRGDADYSIVPIENSSEGVVGETLDVLVDSPLKVCGEIRTPVHHNLMAKCSMDQVRRIYSKMQVFAQCGEWLASNLPEADLLDVGSTTQAAQRAAEEPGGAAIAHEEAARLYELTILSANIEDDPHNETRFFVLGRDSARPTGMDKTSVLCFIKDEVGALLHLLEPFREHGLNLTFIQSRPSRRRVWDYCFFMDFGGHEEDPAVAAALEKVRQQCREMKILGSYPVSN
jgi:chorismate mutase/prephenate dehydratase